MAFNASRKLCLERYEKSPFWTEGYRKLYVVAARAARVTDTQEAALAGLWRWRDATARMVDENPVYVMSNSELLRIALACPQSLDDLEACRPLSHYPRIKAAELISLLSSLPRPTAGSVLREAQTPVRDLLADGSSSPSVGEEFCSSGSFSPKALVQNKQVSQMIAGALTLRGASPVMPADEIFKLAGWSSPAIGAARDGLSNQAGRDLSPLFFSAIKGGCSGVDGIALAGDVRGPLTLTLTPKGDNEGEDAPEPYQPQRAGLGQRLDALYDCNVSSGSLSATGSHGLLDSLSIPKSYEEIYEISNRNRRRGKDKSRGDGDNEGEDAPEPYQPQRAAAIPSSVDYGASDFDEQIYFAHVGSGAVEGAVGFDAALDFTEEIGWLVNKEMRMQILGEWIADQEEG